MKPLLERVRRYKYQFLFLGCSALILVATILSFSYVINKANLRRTPVRAANGDISWPVFDGGVDDPGSNTSESTIGVGNAANLAKLWKAALPINADNGLVEEANVSTGSGVIDLVFVNTVKGNLIAFNATTGAKIWEADPSSANYNGQGTKSTPAVDPSGSYVYAYALDGYVHRYNISTGAEVTGTGFPAQTTLLPNNIEKESASLNIANGYLYATISGNDGDYGHYVGHVVAVNLSTGTETVWNAECSNITVLENATSGSGNYCSNNMSGIWARPGVKVDPVTGNVFVATGNGNYNANSGGNNWGDSIIELKPDLSQIVDSYTPATYSSLDSADADLGSTAPVILPTQGGSNTPYMLVQAGKDHIVRLLNRANLSGQSGPRHTGGEMQTITISDEVHEQPAVWVDGSGTTWVFVTDESGDLYAYKVVTSGGVSSLSQVYTENIGVGSSPFVANGVLYLDGNSILALNASTGATLFDSSSLGIGVSQHWESPMVVNGALFTSDGNGNVYALYVPGAGPGSAASSLNPGQSLQASHSIVSVNGLYGLVMQNDGNLVEYNQQGRPLWASNTSGSGNAVVMQYDGNLVVYSSSGRALWASHTSGSGNYLILQDSGTPALFNSGGSILWANVVLRPGQYVQTSDHAYGLVMQNDGNLVEYNQQGRPLWASRTSGDMAGVVVQNDGNLVMYNANGVPVWATNRFGFQSALVLQHDSNIVVYTSSGQATWASGS